MALRLIFFFTTGQEISFGAACPTCTENYYPLLNLQQKDINLYPATYVYDLTDPRGPEDPCY